MSETRKLCPMTGNRPSGKQPCDGDKCAWNLDMGICAVRYAAFAPCAIGDVEKALNSATNVLERIWVKLDGNNN